jgi:hypothetical protein
MAKRSAWAAQKQAEIRAIAAAHSGTLLSKMGRVAFETLHQGVDKAPVEALNLLIISNASFLVKSTMEAMTNPDYGGSEEYRRTHTPAELKVLLREGAPTLGMAAKTHLADVAARHVLESEARDATARLEERVKAYLRDRKIPITTLEDKMDLMTAMRNHLRSKRSPGAELANGADMLTIERLYLKERKMSRQFKLEEATEINQYYKRICNGSRFTANQRKTIRKFVERELPGIHNRMNSVLKGLRDGAADISELSRQQAEIGRDFVQSARCQFLKQFRPSARVLTRSARPSPTVATKLGSHEERKGSYVPREKTPNQRKQEIKKLGAASRATGRPFDASAYCLSEIEKENQQSAAILRRMLREGQINSNAITGLFGSGSLATRIFVCASQLPAFEETFGKGQFNVLAKGIAYMGPEGKIITRAKRAFQSPLAEKIFNFLDQKGFLETGHSGGDVVYLARTMSLNSHGLLASTEEQLKLFKEQGSPSYKPTPPTR